MWYSKSMPQKFCFYLFINFFLLGHPKKIPFKNQAAEVAKMQHKSGSPFRS